MSRSSQGRRVVAAQVRRLFPPLVIFDDASLAQVGGWCSLTKKSVSGLKHVVAPPIIRCYDKPFEIGPVPPTSWFTSGTPYHDWRDRRKRKNRARHPDELTWLLSVPCALTVKGVGVFKIRRDRIRTCPKRDKKRQLGGGGDVIKYLKTQLIWTDFCLTSFEIWWIPCHISDIWPAFRRCHTTFFQHVILWRNLYSVLFRLYDSYFLVNNKAFFFFFKIVTL